MSGQDQSYLILDHDADLCSCCIDLLPAGQTDNDDGLVVDVQRLSHRDRDGTYAGCAHIHLARRSGERMKIRFFQCSLVHSWLPGYAGAGMVHISSAYLGWAILLPDCSHYTAILGRHR